MIRKRIILLFASLLAFASCSFMHDDELVAQVNGKKLYRSELVKNIPSGLPSEDSLALARNYITAWASEQIINTMAAQQLSEEERDVSKEVEAYRNSLLRYRYEQRYIASKLDTSVSQSEVLAHYKANPGLYELSMPIAKARYLRIPKTSPMKDRLVKMLSSDREEDLYMLDSLSYSNATKYTRYGDAWVDMVTIARDFGTDYGTLIASMRDSSFIDIVDEQGMEHIAYLSTYIPSGKVPPLDYCSDKIKEVIVNQRKYLLSSNLEQDLLDDAKKKGNFIIYENNER